MSLYSPTFLSPESIAVDGNQDNVFSWQFNGATQTDYQVKIYDLNNNLVYDSAKITSSNTSHTVPALTLTNGNIYKWQVTVWEDAESAESDWVVFGANSSPSVLINSFSNPLNAQNYLFQAQYTQSESVPVKCFKFILYDNLDNVVEDSGWIYSSTLEHQITGMINGSTYQIECQVINQYDQIATSGKQSFSVSYILPDDISELIITPLNDIGAIKLSWTNLKQVLGVVSGTYNYITSKFLKGISLDNGSTLTYNEDIPNNFTIVYWVKLPSNFNGVFLLMGNDYEIGYDGTRFYYKNQYRTVAGLPRNLPTDEFSVGIKSSRVIIKTSIYTEIIR